MKTIKRYLSILLTLSMIMCCTSVFTVNAVPSAEDNKIAIEVAENLISENELQPMMASRCGGIVYVDYSMKPNDLFYPNSIIYYTSNGTSSGAVYSIIYTNSFGGTIMRHDLLSYNGSTLGHGNIVGPHTHTYRWWVHDGVNRYQETSVVSYTG